MDENNNQEQKSLAQQTADKAKSTIKNKAKKKLFEIIKPYIPYILAGIGIFLLALLFIGIIMAIPYLINQAINKILGIFKPQTGEGNNTTSTSIVRIDDFGAYKVDADSIVDQILLNLEEQEVDNKEIGLTKKRILKYIEAEVKTTCIKTEHPHNHFDGNIEIKRIRTTGASKIPLTYKKYDDFCEMVEKENSNVFNCFSINPNNFYLCIAKGGDTITYEDFDNQTTQSQPLGDSIIIEEIDYKKYVQNYSVPLNFLISLHLISQDVDFMDETLDLMVGKGNNNLIELTYVDTSFENVMQYDYTGTITTTLRDGIIKGNKDKIIVSVGNSMNQEEYNEYAASVSNPQIIDDINTIKAYYNVVNNHKKIATSNGGELYVTNVDTWIKVAEKEITGGNDTPTGEHTNRKVVKDEDLYTRDMYITDETGSILNAKKETKHIIIEEIVTTRSTNTNYTIVDKEGTMNVMSFVDLIKKYPTAEDNITSAPSLLFNILQEQENTQSLEKIMRYVLYLLNDVDYGVMEDELEVLLSESFIEHTFAANLTNYLKLFFKGYGYRAPQSDDGEYYKMYVKESESGFPIIGDANLQWASYQSNFGLPGKILHNGKEIEVENVQEYINTNCLTKGSEETYTSAEVTAMEIYIEKELVNTINESVQTAIYEYVSEQTSGLALSRQQLYPLVAITSSLNHLPEINGKTFKDVYLEASQKYEKDSWQHNQYIWDEWWSYLGEDTADDIIARDAQFETYTKGVFDYSLSEYGIPYTEDRTTYVYYTQEQIDKYSNKENKTITRTSEKTEEIFTTVMSGGEFIPDETGIIKGYYISTMGRKFTILIQGQIDGWGDCCNRAASAIVASGYSKETPEELVKQFNKHYINDSIIPETQDYWHLYKLKRTEFILSHKSVSQYTPILREQLQKGGYALVWLNNDEQLYEGKSKTNWTTLYHWVAVIDYRVHEGKEQIAVADYRGADWYDIDEFKWGVTHIALINEE